jgi:hypothetical protein
VVFLSTQPGKNVADKTHSVLKMFEEAGECLVQMLFSYEGRGQKIKKPTKAFPRVSFGCLW